MSARLTAEPRDVVDLAEEDFDPDRKKTVATLILAEEDFVVYLDEEEFVRWHGSAVSTHLGPRRSSAP